MIPQRLICPYSLVRDAIAIAAAANPAGWIRLPVRPWHRQLSEMTSRSADFDSRASSDASETKGIDPPPCIAVLNSLCFAGRFIRPQSTQSVQRQSVLQSRLVSRLVVWGWGSCSAGCPAGARYVRREFESRSRHKVCPCCLGGAVVVLLCATTTLICCREK